MRVDEVQHGRATTLDLLLKGAPEGTPVASLRAEARIVFAEATGDVLLRVEGAALRAEPADARSRAALSRLREAIPHHLAWVACVTPAQGRTERVTLDVRELASMHIFPEPTEMGVDEKIVEELQRRYRRLRTVDDTITYLTEKILLLPTEPGGMPRALLSGSPSPETGPRRAFRLYGEGIAVDVARGDDERLRVVRVVASRRPAQNDERRPILLVFGQLRFCDATVAGQLRGSTRTELDRIVETAGSYLAVWKEYNAIERESILRRAREFGWLRYEARKALPDGNVRFELDRSAEAEEKLAALRDEDAIDLEAGASPPLELLGGEPGEGAGERAPSGRVFAGRVAAWSAARRTIDVAPLLRRGDEDPPEPPMKGVLFVSLNGDRTRLQRREEAHARIASAECEMTQLGLLIEGSPVRERRRRAELPLSPAAREAFGGAPTTRQIEALKVALETPDIALIQGPPGTGKTRTIAALQIRLAEIAEERAGVAGHTLLTSYQHDAVENAAEKTLVFGLPAIKVGARRGQSQENDGFDRWRRERIEAVRGALASYAERPASAILRRVRSLAIAYAQAPRHGEDAAALLTEVSRLCEGLLPASLGDRLLALRQRLAVERVAPLDDAGADRELARKAVRALRVEPISFADDGPANAHKAMRRLEAVGALADAERALLERAAVWDEASVPPFLGDLAALQSALIDRLSEERPKGPPAPNADVQAVLAEVVDALYRRVRESVEGEDAVLYEYLDDLENDVDGVRAAIRDYTVVLASTCQHAVGREMARAKGDVVEFENVIVDEAARANPLDLFIPMARARRRIILVGDHRQLPHILEPDVERRLEESKSAATQEVLRKSLFYRLFTSLKEREQRDGVRRTVTLDVQYRMHPVLGEFVSDTFYKRHGEAFTSGRPASDFVHSIERYGSAVAAWVDIPHSAGRETGRTSKRRIPEARWIAQEAARLVRERKDLTVGVISFYAAQVDEILRALETLGMSERGEDGSLQVAAHLRETDRLRVGTVDGFQGKEFDVVLLSMTRSNDLPAGDGGARRRKFGHLQLENRLCVAMSRQQRLLVVVGDAGMLAGPAATEALRGLQAFRRLCEGEHGIVLSA